jgi:exodeoxyribonuclease V gamma subunit
MLRLHFANHLERLTDRLVEQLGARDRSPFEVDEVVIPSAALRRHLTLQLAMRHGLCAQVRYRWLAQWLWRQMGQLLPRRARSRPGPRRCWPGASTRPSATRPSTPPTTGSRPTSPTPTT